jgi:hypothetical protein
MKTFLLTAMLIGSLAVSASAANTFYVMFDKTKKQCSIATSAPTETEKFSMMGQFGSEAEAKKAMAGMKECKKM